MCIRDRDISRQPLEEEGAHDVRWERSAGAGEEALEMVNDFCGLSAASDDRKELNAVRGLGAARLRMASLSSS